jgi:competence protein ComEC
MWLSGLRAGGAMAQVRAGARAGTWDVPRPRNFAWPSGIALGNALKTLQRWFARDIAAGRLLPWIPIAFGFGIVLYFTADREPAYGRRSDSQLFC